LLISQSWNILSHLDLSLSAFTGEPAVDAMGDGDRDRIASSTALPAFAGEPTADALGDGDVDRIASSTGSRASRRVANETFNSPKKAKISSGGSLSPSSASVLSLSAT